MLSAWEHSPLCLLRNGYAWSRSDVEMLAIGRSFYFRKVKGFNPKTRNIFREKARRKVKEGYDAVVLAHSHMADICFIWSSKPGIYINTEDFQQWGDYVLYETGKGFSSKEV